MMPAPRRRASDSGRGKGGAEMTVQARPATAIPLGRFWREGIDRFGRNRHGRRDGRCCSRSCRRRSGRNSRRGGRHRLTWHRRRSNRGSGRRGHAAVLAADDRSASRAGRNPTGRRSGRRRDSGSSLRCGRCHGPATHRRRGWNCWRHAPLRPLRRRNRPLTHRRPDAARSARCIRRRHQGLFRLRRWRNDRGERRPSRHQKQFAQVLPLTRTQLKLAAAQVAARPPRTQYLLQLCRRNPTANRLFERDRSSVFVDHPPLIGSTLSLKVGRRQLDRRPVRTQRGRPTV